MLRSAATAGFRGREPLVFVILGFFPLIELLVSIQQLSVDKWNLSIYIKIIYIYISIYIKNTCWEENGRTRKDLLKFKL